MVTPETVRVHRLEGYPTVLAAGKRLHFEVQMTRLAFAPIMKDNKFVEEKVEGEASDSLSASTRLLR